MTTPSRIPTPSVNLKERIAALQQRTLSIDARPSSPTIVTPPPTSAKGLRDKIAKFEKRGRVPAPRGSFGLGAPPLAENGPQKRRGELYGNRIPNGVRVSYSGTSLSRSGSPFDSARSFSVPHTDGEDGEMPDSPSYLPSPFSSPPSSPVSPDSLFTSVYPVQPSTPDYDGCNREITATSSPIIAIPMSERSQPEDEHLEAEVTQPSIVISSEELILEVPSIQKNTLVEVAQQSVQSTYPTSSPSIPAPLVNAAIPSPAVHEPKEPPSHIEVSEPPMLPELLFGSPASPPSASGEDHAPESITLQAPPEKGSIHTEERSVELTPDTANVSQALSEKGPSLANTHIEARNVELIANTKNAVQMPLGNGFRSTPPHSEAHPAQLVADTAKVLQTTQEKDLSLTPTRTGGHLAKLASDAVKQMSPPKKDISIIPTHITPTDPASPILAKEHILNYSDTTARQNIVVSLPADEDVVLESPSPLPNPYDDNLPTTTSLEPLFENAHVIVGPSTPTPLNDEAAIYDDKSEHHLEEQVITTETTAKEDFTSPESPIGPHTLANVVASLGQMVADIHHLFPDQLSPLNSPPMYRPMTLEPTPESKPSRNLDSGKETKKPVNLTIHLDSETGLESKEIKPNAAFGTQAATSTPEALAAADSLNAPSDSTESALIASPSSSFLSTPSSTHVRPISMVETSPAQVEVGKRVTLLPRRTVYIPPQAQQRDLIHFPPTPGPQAVDTQFGTVSIGHTTTHSRKTSFSAVVHGKIADMPSASSMPSMLSAPTTPSKRNTIAGEAVTSPGQGELASLLQSAALLEETLEKGELPGEVSPDAASVKRAKEEQEKAEAEGKVKTEEERKAAAVKNRVSAQPQKRMKRSFLMLSGKSSQQRDRSVSSPEGQTTDSKDLTDRPHLPCKSTEGSGRLSESSSFQTVHAPSVEIHAESPEREADTNSHTSPKSPRQYLASLRRFASGGRASTGSNGTHPRLSASTSSEMSSDDSVPLATPPDNGLDSAGSGSSVRSSYGSGIPWPSLSPKKNGSVGRAAAFAGKIWNRGRSKSSNSPYETIDRLTKAAAVRAAAASIPHLDATVFSVDVPIPELSDTLLPFPQPESGSPRRSKSFQTMPTSQFPPIYTPVPTSPVYTPQKSPAGLRTALRPEDAMQSLHIDSFLTGKELHRPTSLLSEGVSEGSSHSSFISPLFDSFPSVPTSTSPSLPDSPYVVHGQDDRPVISEHPVAPTHPKLALRAPSFFDAAPLSSAVVGAEFLPGPSPAPPSVTLPPMSFEWQLFPEEHH